MNLCVSNASDFYAISGLSLAPHKTIPLVVKWHAPDFGWVNLNTNGSSLGNLGPDGWGVVIRDHNLKWIYGFAQQIGHAYSVMIELWAIRDGLSLDISMDFPRVCVELYVLLVVSYLVNLSKFHPYLMTLVHDYRLLLQAIPNSHVSHIFREANKCVDAMASLGRTQSINFAVFSSPSKSILGLIDFDISAEVCLHLVHAPG